MSLVERAPKLFAPIGLLFIAFFFGLRPSIFLKGMIMGGNLVAILAVLLFWLWEVWHPELTIRKRPKPEIALDLTFPGPRKLN